ncbi:DNA sulfur modification protein DndD [Demequina rhizosphaerae]|uniref:DNA sulfur modification protein DndD n=1 Tax=Demequina rhizosphaerae TaxID=1638985 RepID=UPI0007854DA2|nr:DNA sulfur modification protein DndD [Demequina rhizosphaerae]
MIINQLVLHNVGTFAGRNVLDLTPTDPSRPVVVVGGLNGAGKTTILESIQLALYGALGRPSGRRTGSYENYLRGLMHRGADPSEGAAIELTFTAYQEGREHTFWIRRSWKPAGASIREILLVKVDGRHDETLMSTWNEYVETFLPRGIAGLFFFDGEQIEALADLDRSQQVLGSALAALLGLDLVDQLSTDLAVLKRRKAGHRLPDDVDRDIREAESALTDRRREEERATEVLSGAVTALEHARRESTETAEAFGAAGGSLLEQREAIEAAVEASRAELAACEDEVRLRLADEGPLLQVTQLIDRLAVQVQREASGRRDAELLSEISDRDREVIALLGRQALSAELITAVDAHLSTDRERRSRSAAQEIVVGVGEPGEINRLVSSRLPAARSVLRGGLERRASLRDNLDRLERSLTAIPDPESIAPLKEAREAAREALRRCEAIVGVASDSLERATADRARAAQRYEAALDRAAHANLAVEDSARVVHHIDRVRATLEALRIEATRRHLERIANLIHEALGMLLRKDHLITGVRIDPDSHTIELAGSNGGPLPAKDLSAGERQLLAVALLWGLARAAGQPLPVIVDTPLGRLDGSHRAHLLDRYFPNASHQVVLLSTDTEIDEAAFERMESHVGRSYRLVFDIDANATRVEEGYFWK